METTLSPNRPSNAPLTERRRRSRLQGETLAWLLPASPRMAAHLPTDDEAWEVRVYNVSRLGVGFTSTEPMQLGKNHGLRIGRGPMTRARLICIVACRQSEEGVYAIGAEFVDTSRSGLSRAG